MEQISQTKFSQMEPNIKGVGALRVKDTAITEYIQITCKMVNIN